MEETPVAVAVPAPTLRSARVDGSWLQEVWRLKLAEAETLPTIPGMTSMGEVDKVRRPGPECDCMRRAPSDARLGSPAHSTVPRAGLPGGPQALTADNLESSCLSRAQRTRTAETHVAELRSVRAVLRDYCRTTTLHGIALIGDESYGALERSLWAVAVVASAAILAALYYFEWGDYAAAPTVTRIELNDMPTYSFPFPAVTVCPAVRIKVPVMVNVIRAYLRDYDIGGVNSTTFLASGNADQLLLGVFRTLSDYRHPKFRLMKYGLSSIGRMLPYLDGLAISQIMIQARLTCSDVLAHCYWKGIAFACCEQFQFQRTEMGYCMSFNSRTSTGPKILCSEKNCHHVWSTGPGTGLVLVFKTNHQQLGVLQNATTHFGKNKGSISNYEDSLLEFQPGFKRESPGSVWETEEMFLENHDLARQDHMLVMVHDRKRFPDVTKAFSLSTLQRSDYSMAVAFSSTAAGEALRELPPEVRNCLFDGEVKVKLARTYSQSECIAECRVLHAAKKCGCRPFYVEAYEGAFYKGIPECRFSQLPCLSGLNLVAINCSHCTMECEFSDYSVRMYPSINVNIRDANLGTTVEISYDAYRTAVLHRQEIALSYIDMLVSAGGLASLCLGCSILTTLDLLHMFLRVVQVALGFPLKPIYQKAGPGSHM